MAPLRTQPYVCAECGKQSEETGIPILTLEGVKDSYVSPMDWKHLRDKFMCGTCVAAKQEEFDEEWAQKIAQDVLGYMEGEYESADDFVLKRATAIIAERYGVKAS